MPPKVDPQAVASEVADAIEEAAATVPETATDAMAELRGMLGDVVTRLDALEEKITTPPVAANTVEGGTETAAEAVQDVAETATEAIEAVTDAAVEAVEAAASPVAEVEETVEEPVADAAETVTEPIAEAAQEAEDFTERIPERVHPLFRKLGRGRD